MNLLLYSFIVFLLDFMDVGTLEMALGVCFSPHACGTFWVDRRLSSK